MIDTRRTVRLAAVVVAFVVAFLSLARGIHVGPDGDRPVFDIDEAHKLSESYYYHLFFETGEWDHADWQADFYARTNPPVAKYVFGAALATGGLHVHDRALQAEFERLWRIPTALREKVPDAMLRITRHVSAAYGAGIVALLVGVGWSIGGPLAGVLAGLLLLTVPIFTDNARVGLTDTILIFHLTLTLPVTLWAARTLRRPGSRARTALLAAIVPGMAIALAVGSKMNGALTGPVYGMALVAAALIEPGESSRGRQVGRALLATAATGVIALGLLVAFDPTLQDGPIARLLEAFTTFGDWLMTQQLDPGPPLLGTFERIAYVGFFTLRSPTLLLPGLVGALGAGVMVVGFCLGIVRLAARLVPGDGGGRTSPGDAAVVLVWIVCVLVGVSLWIPLLWDRYVLPPSVAVDLCVALGVAGLPLGLGRRWIPRLAAIAGATAGLAALAWWVTDPRWIDPRSSPRIRDAQVRQDYFDAALAHPESVMRQQHAGVLFVMLGSGPEACARLEAALALLAESSPDDRSATIRRATLQQQLIQARIMAHDLPGAQKAALAYVESLEQLKSGLRTSDPLVRGAFDQVLTDGRAVVSRLRAVPSG